MTIKAGEPYDSWKVPRLAQGTGLRLKRAFEFFPQLYDGYEHRRTLGAQSHGVEEGGPAPNADLLGGAKTFAFAKHKAPAFGDDVESSSGSDG